MVEELRKKLLDSIIKHGINDKKTYDISVQLDNEINKYYKKIKKTKKVLPNQKWSCIIKRERNII